MSGIDPKSPFLSLSREELLDALSAFAKNWLAHDGCWFLAAEEKMGIEKAMDLDRESWRKFAHFEAKRIMETFGIEKDGGLEALKKALSFRMYSLINPFSFEWKNGGGTLLFTMETCAVQEKREKKNLPSFPCRSVGEVEFSVFAETVDRRIRTRCIFCPPDEVSDRHCSWEFFLTE